MALARVILICPLALAARFHDLPKSPELGTCSYSCGARNARTTLDGDIVDFKIGFGQHIEYTRKLGSCLSNCFVLKGQPFGQLFETKTCPQGSHAVAATYIGMMRTATLCCEELRCPKNALQETTANASRQNATAESKGLGQDECAHPCGATIVTGNIGSKIINFIIGAGNGIHYQRSDLNCLGKCVALPQSSEKCRVVLPGSIKVSYTNFDDESYKLCCKSLTCPTAQLAKPPGQEDIWADGQSYRFSCKTGQGRPFESYWTGAENSFEACASLCARDNECRSMDFTADNNSGHLVEGAWKKDACRLYKVDAARSQDAGGWHARQFCVKAIG